MNKYVNFKINTFKLSSFTWNISNINYTISAPQSELRDHWVGMLSGGFKQFKLLSTIIDKFCKQRPVIFVVGANIGLNEVALSKIDGSLIYSFEPFPSTFKYLQSNIYKNGIENVNIFNFGLSCMKGKQLIGVANDSGSNSIGLAETSKSVLCDFDTIDEFFKAHNIHRLDFLKIDVEGHDIDVMKGGQTVIRKYKPVIQIEICKIESSGCFLLYDIEWFRDFLSEFTCRFYELYKTRIIDIPDLDKFLARDVIQNDILIVME